MEIISTTISGIYELYSDIGYTVIKYVVLTKNNGHSYSIMQTEGLVPLSKWKIMYSAIINAY